MVQKLPSLQSERIVSQWIPCVLCWWGQLVFFQGLSLLTKTHRDESENQSIRQCLSQDNAPIKPRLQQQPPPLHVNTRAFDCRSFQKVGNLNLVWVGWTIYPESTILAPGDGNLNEPVFKSSNAQGVFGEEGGMKLFELIDAWPTRKRFELKPALNLSQQVDTYIWWHHALNFILWITLIQFLILD